MPSAAVPAGELSISDQPPPTAGAVPTDQAPGDEPTADGTSAEGEPARSAPAEPAPAPAPAAAAEPDPPSAAEPAVEGEPDGLAVAEADGSTTGTDGPASAPAAGAPRPARAGLGIPALGVAGLLLVLLVAENVMWVPGAQRMLDVAAPWSTYSLPLLAMVALWWNCWPAARWPRPLAGAALTGSVVGVGLLLCLAGQAVIGTSAPSRLLGTSDEPALGHLVSFPFAEPLAAFVFVTFLQLTFVCRKWPLSGLPAVPAGLAALATSWAIGTAGYLLLANWDSVPAPARAAIGLRNPSGPIDALDLIGILLCVTIWQMAVFFLLDGYPATLVPTRAGYLAAANVLSVGGGVGLYVILHDVLNRTVPEISAAAGVIVAATLIVGLLLEQWPARLLGSPHAQRAALLSSAAVIAIGAGFALRALSLSIQTWTRDPAQLWVAVTGLNFIGAGIIVHVAFWRRWPLTPRE
jgi:hypothetical protein